MSRGKEITVGELAALFEGTVEGDAARVVRGPAGLVEAGPDEVSFLAQANYIQLARETRAGAVLVGHDVDLAREGLTLVRCADPERSFTKVVLAFAPDLPELAKGIHPTALVHSSATLGTGVRIGAYATVDAGAALGDGVTLHPHTHVGAHARLGDGTSLMPNVVLYPYTEVGARCLVHAGTVLGSDGFGFHFEGGAWRKTPQVGRVVVEDDVEIGANVTVDCARFGATRIGAGTKIDNLVQIAHNCVIGRGCLILSQVGIAGSTVVEDGVIIAGQAGIKGHARIGKGARIAGGSGVTKDVPPGEEWFGYPAGPSRAKMRALASAERAGEGVRELRRELRELRRELDALRAGSDPAGGAR